jgi:uncharacterized protein (TIGR02001 family)
VATTWTAAHWCAALALAAAGAAGAQDTASSLNGYVTLGNGYWNHGLSQNDGLSLQLGVDYQHHTGFIAGAWAANVDYALEFSYDRPREIEADVYVGYHDRYPVWSWTVMLGRYLYPGAAINYDYDELSATVGFRDRVFYTAAYSDAYYARPRSALNQELSVVLPLRGDLELGAALGRFTVANGGVDITHFNVGVSKLVGRVALDLRYYDGNHDRLSFLGDPDANHYVLSVSYALRSRRSGPF